MAQSPETSAGDHLPLQRIRLWQHRRAVRQVLLAYAPGADALVDQLRSTAAPLRFVLLQVAIPLYFAREEGWVIRGTRGEMAAMMYLRRQELQGIRILHIDDINVCARYRRHGLANRLMDWAEELARREQRPFLKLAVTVANTPAVTLYRRLGYEEEHHRFFSYDPAMPAMSPPESTDISLRPLARQPARTANQQFYSTEMKVSSPAVADLMVTYYSRGAGGDGVPKTPPLRYAILCGSQPIGYGDAYCRGEQWNLRLNLDPAYWGTESERKAIQLLNGAVSKVAAAGRRNGETGSSFALHVPSAAHFDALSEGTPSLATLLGLHPETYTRMIMVKVLAATAPN